MMTPSVPVVGPFLEMGFSCDWLLRHNKLQATRGIGLRSNKSCPSRSPPPLYTLSHPLSPWLSCKTSVTLASLQAFSSTQVRFDQVEGVW